MSRHPSKREKIAASLILAVAFFAIIILPVIIWPAQTLDFYLFLAEVVGVIAGIFTLGWAIAVAIEWRAARKRD